MTDRENSEQTMIPKRLLEVALKQQANIGRDYDSSGKHIAYWYRARGSDWKVYRHSVQGMIALLRHHGGYQA